MAALVGAGVTGGAGLSLLATQFERAWLWPAAGALWLATACAALWWQRHHRLANAQAALPSDAPRPAIANPTGPTQAMRPADPVDPLSLGDADPVRSSTPAYHVDVAVLGRLVGNEPTLVAQLLGGFLAQSQPLVDAIVTALAAGDLHQAGMQAHRLKSNARSVGAHALGEWCELIERAGKQLDHAALVTAGSALADEWQRVRSELAPQAATPAGSDTMPALASTPRPALSKGEANANAELA
jgi:HPt (histidine-containing phosphotransfer) domain-containing protein